MTSIQIQDVSRWYGNVVAINGVTMNIGPGVTGLLGPNGAGKSTLIHMMGGFLEPSSGTLTLEGTPIWRNPSVYENIGLVPERESAYDFLTGEQFIVSMAKLHKLGDPRAAARRAIAMVEMDYAAARPIGTYSKGMKQRIKMASALVHDPAVLLLDEPFNGMDPRQRIQLMDLIRRMAAEGRTILFSSHILEEVERLATHIEVIVSGRHAASGDFREIRRLMTDRPYQVTVRSTDDRTLASAIIADGSASSVELTDGKLQVEATDFHRFTWLLPQLAKNAGVRLWEISPSDESLESVFSYLVGK
ncbi:ABC transporter ATP-binding protein [Actinocorallia longicatena]|uniref:ABC transporter ATP-binding protein n=1 Tax=Actinocorallia longicatena TaxID=111803 RepID=A0ABP6Q681_9ACTN